MKNLDDILKIVAGYQVSKVLFAAVEFEIFTAISGTGKTIEVLSAESREWPLNRIVTHAYDTTIAQFKNADEGSSQ